MSESGAGPGVRVVLATAPSPEVGEKLVRALVNERMVACGTIIPGGVSIYRWQGSVQRETEALLILKTTAAAVPRVIDRLTELHPYEVPEALALDVVKGNKAYLEWVAAETGGDSDS